MNFVQPLRSSSFLPKFIFTLNLANRLSFPSTLNLLRSGILLGFILSVSNVLAATYIKDIIYPVPADQSRQQATQNALKLLQTEALQESGVLLKQVYSSYAAEGITWNHEYISQLSSAVSMSDILVDEFDGKELYLRAKLEINDDTLLKGFADFETLQKMEKEMENLKSQLDALHVEREKQQSRIRQQKIQTEEDRMTLQALRQRITLLERLNHEQLQEDQRIDRISKQAFKLKSSVQRRNKKRYQQFIEDTEFVKQAWEPGLTIKDLKQFHRFVSRPFYSESQKRNIYFRDPLSAFDRLKNQDVYIMSQGRIDGRQHYLLIITPKDDTSINHVFIAKTIRHISADQIAVELHPIADQEQVYDLSLN